MHQKDFAPIFIILVAVVVLTLGVAGWLFADKVQQKQEQATNAYLRPTASGQTSSAATNSVAFPTPPSINLSSTAALVSTSSVSISNWLTYTDSQDGFSFQYPPKCHFAISSLSDRRVISFIPCASDVSYLMSILVFHKNPGQSVLKYWRTATGLVIVSSTPMTINGYAALNLEEEIPPQSEGESGPISVLLLMRKDATLIVAFNPSPLDFLGQDRVPAAILNSFRF